MPWLQVIFSTAPEAAEALSEHLSAEGAAAVTFEDAADQPLYEPEPGTTPLWGSTRVIGLFTADLDLDGMVRSLTARLAPAPLPPWKAVPLEDRAWDREWMRHFQPLRCGNRLWIVPSWHAPPDPDGINILLDPGLAFGTGTHPTTRLCLEWLDGWEGAGKVAVDYGCGSGILALAAAKLGAAPVWAVDNDPQALLATAENAARNGLCAPIHTALPADLPPLEADLLIANILARPLIDLAATLTHHVRPGGRLVLSGILAEQAQEVAAAYRRGFEMQPPVESEGWVRLEGQRK